MIQVAAAIIWLEGRILICQREDGGSCANLWEFPGGKLEEDETPEECAVRECKEELGIDILLHGTYATSQYRYPEREIAFVFFCAEIGQGSIVPTVHKNVQWVLPCELRNYQFCPADVEIVEQLMKIDVRNRL